MVLAAIVAPEIAAETAARIEAWEKSEKSPMLIMQNERVTPTAPETTAQTSPKISHKIVETF